MQRGMFLVIDGTDGSGKSTQYEQLHQHLEDAGYEIEHIHFPRYNEPSSYFVREYLKGHYGPLDQVGPYTASLFYALDRYQAAFDIRKNLEAGKIILCDRYVSSNMAHQGAKFRHAEERRGYFIWLDNLEFEMLRIPRPDMTFILHTPIDTIQDRLLTKTNSSTHIKKDIHELDLGHISKSLEVYEDLCQLFPKDFTRIDSMRGGKLLSVEEVHKVIWEKLLPRLPEPTRKKNSSRSTVKAAHVEPPSISTDNPYVHKQDGLTTMTEAGKAYLSSTVTDTEGNVYAFTDKLSPVTIAAAMARLSRRGDDMRLTILDEFAHTLDKDKQLLHRVITAYGDDSVQQLAGQHIVVEKASNLLTKKLEWGRLAAYLEQSTRYIYYDQKDAHGHYKFHVPKHLEPRLKETYITTLNQIFELYSHMVRDLTTYIQTKSTTPEAERDSPWRSATKAQACDAVRPVLPVATESTVGIYASGQALENLIMHLLSDELPEARAAGEAILRETRKVIPVFLERADKPDRGGALVAYRANTRAAVQKLAEEYLPPNHADDMEAVTLTHVSPHSELDIVADILYEHSDQPLAAIRATVDNWPYERKAQILQAYLGERLNRRHRPGRALENIHYSWDLICDYGIFRDLQRHRMVDDLEWQALSPRYGYEIPELIEEAGLSDDFERCFDLSLNLYSQLQQAGYALEAQYATLLGHRMRWKITYNAREAFHLHELRTSPQGHPGYRKLVMQMHDTLSEVHPLLVAGMKFVNRNEDPELSRLAAERYAQYKLQSLS